MLFRFNKVDSPLRSYCDEKDKTAPFISFLLKNQTIIEQNLTIPLRIYQQLTLHSTEHHSRNSQ